MVVHRKFVFPRHGDTLADVARRELGDAVDDGSGATQDPAQLIASWNLHLAIRRSPTDDPGRLLPTDIVYLEPPLA